ncbi:MAG: flagellar biosynthesis anti-sigma factor FlgM [Candidatus Desulfofervidus auxilii]|nr:flagellar biosynthesis anti-sigma factor FlgM [Candidatus Desulfofervidus auxilii]
MKISKKTVGLEPGYLEQMKSVQEKVNVKKVSKFNKVKEKVEISAKAQELQKFKKILKEIPAVRKEKVAELKEALEKGVYQVNNKKLAVKILQEGILNIFKVK